jgi:hypothetical protein
MGISIERPSTSIGDDEWWARFHHFRSQINYHRNRLRFQHHASPMDAQIAVIALNNERRAEIHKLLNKIRKVVANLQIDDRKRDAINIKIAALQAEVDKSKTGAGALTGLFIEVCGGLGEGAEKLEPLVKLVERVARAFWGAFEEQKALPKPDAKRLPKPDAKKPSTPATPPRPPVQDLDDELPF